ncbi:MAG: thymidylate kinase [Bryobacteraceae bacterium]|nr:thymidylate kinase [Bryobacteraceae bacterium]
MSSKPARPAHLTPGELKKIIAELEQRRGLLIAFEGPDGAGKTTQRKLFRTWLKGEGHDAVTTKWNSSELVKPLTRTRKSIRVLSPLEYCLFHAADYRHRLETEILPALCKGKTVIADRYLFTGLARDAARGLDFHWVLRLYGPILWPDVVFHFAVTPGTSAKRVLAGGVPSYYEAGQDVTGISDPAASYEQFMGRVIQEYAALALIFRFSTVDAEKSIYEQHRAIRRLFQEGERRSWQEYNARAVAEYLMCRPEAHND